MIEREHHRKAFEGYYAMGPKRSLARLAETLGVSRNAVKSWSRAFDWQTRVAERDREVAASIASQARDSEVDSGVRNRELVRDALVRIAQDISERRMKASYTDLDRLIRLEAFLEGKVESRQEIVSQELEGKSLSELREMLRAEMAELAGLSEESGKTPTGRSGRRRPARRRHHDGPPRSSSRGAASGA